MVELADNNSPTVNRVAPAISSDRGVASHYDDLLTLSDERLKQHLANELASELWSRLPISRVAETSGSRGIEHTIRIVTASASKVQAWYQELSHFVPAIARAAIEFRGEELTNELQAELAAEMEVQMLEQVRYPIPDRSFVDFKFADLPPSDAWTQAHRRMEQACLEFANHVFALFDTLQQKRLVGQIQETSSTCRFTFFQRVAIAVTSRINTEKRTKRDPDFQIPGHLVLLEETFQISDFDIQYRHGQCAHHVRNPVLNGPNETEHPLPPKYSQLIDSCPSWMADSIRVLEGELFREERVEWDLHTETRTAEKVVERVRRCPAVVFGPYILAGWGEDVIAEEERRRIKKQDDAMRRETGKKAGLYHLLSLAVSGVSVAVISFGGMATALTISLAILLGLVAMVLAGNAAHLAAFARGSLSAGRVLLHSTLIGATVFAVQGVMFGLLHWSLPAFGIAAISVVVAAITFKVKTATTELGGFSVG